jgi:broad specificity phosphatase PhoE
MPITLHFVRHAQGYHNLGAQFHSLRDPALTPLGEKQCATLRSKLLDTYGVDPNKVTLVTASPLTRTIHTAALTFAETLRLKGKKMEIMALPTAQETSDYPCDTGSEPEVLKVACAKAGWPVDLSRVYADPDWIDKTPSSPYAPTNTKLKARARETRRILLREAKKLQAQTTRDVEVALVTHGGLLHYLTEDWEDANFGFGTGWKNTELRSYIFVDESDANGAHLQETSHSRSIRGKTAPMFPAGGAEQEALFQDTMRAWEDQGLETGASVEREQGMGEDNYLERTMSQVSQNEMEAGGSRVKAAA